MIGVDKNHGKIIHKNYLKVIVKDLQNQISDNYNVTDENQNITKVFDFEPLDMLLNYPYVGRYINIGGDEAEAADVFTIDEYNFKQAVKEYALLKDTFGIDEDELSDVALLDHRLDVFDQLFFALPRCYGNHVVMRIADCRQSLNNLNKERIVANGILSCRQNNPNHV